MQAKENILISQKMLINSKHNLVLRFRPSCTAGINQLSYPRVATGLTSYPNAGE